MSSSIGRVGNLTGWDVLRRDHRRCVVAAQWGISETHVAVELESMFKQGGQSGTQDISPAAHLVVGAAPSTLLLELGHPLCQRQIDAVQILRNQDHRVGPVLRGIGLPRIEDRDPGNPRPVALSH